MTRPVTSAHEPTRDQVLRRDDEQGAGGSSTTTVRGRRSRRWGSAVAVSAVLAGSGVLVAGPASATQRDLLGRIKACESGGSYTAVNPSSGASGAYQFLDSTWRTVPASAGYATAAAAPPVVQDRAAAQLFAREGSAPWLASAACWQAAGTPSTLPERAPTSGSDRLGGPGPDAERGLGAQVQDGQHGGQAGDLLGPQDAQHGGARHAGDREVAEH